MKKIALTSLLAMFAVSGANAAINDNPLYRPMEGKFVSETMLHHIPKKQQNLIWVRNLHTV